MSHKAFWLREVTTDNEDVAGGVVLAQRGEELLKACCEACGIPEFGHQS
jgi:hypothetical protein